MNLDLPEPCPQLPGTVSLATFVEQRLHITLDTFELPGAHLHGVTVVDSKCFDSDADAAFRLSFWQSTQTYMNYLKHHQVRSAACLTLLQ